MPLQKSKLMQYFLSPLGGGVLTRYGDYCCCSALNNNLCNNLIEEVRYSAVQNK